MTNRAMRQCWMLLALLAAGCGGPTPFAPARLDESVQCGLLQWWNSGFTWCGAGHMDPQGSCSYVDYNPHDGTNNWWDTDLAVPGSTQVQLRHDSKLVSQGVHPWGWQPTFDDQVTGRRFSFLHLRPQNQYTTTVGMIYPSGTVVGLSGGDTADTGLPTYSSGAHLCVQSVDYYRNTVGPAGTDPCGPIVSQLPNDWRLPVDFNGDGMTDFAQYWNDAGNWSTDVHLSTGSSFGLARWATQQGGDIGSWVTGDFNGDGRTDFAQYWNDAGNWSVDVHLAQAGGTFGLARWATQQGGYVGAWTIGDFNGDGMTDFAQYWNDAGNWSTDVHLSTGTSFGIARWATGQGGNIGSWVTGDFNGDGRTDFAQYWNDAGNWSIDVHPSSGSGFGIQRWATAQGGYIGSWVTGDFDGDGRTDFAQHWNDAGNWSVDVHLAQAGNTFGIARWATQQGGNLGTWVTGDFDGDGRTDFAQYWNDAGNWSTDVHPSTGSSFGIARWATGQGGNIGSWVTGDFNGDGRTDFAQYWNDAGNWSTDVHPSTGSSFGIARWATGQGGYVGNWVSGYY